MIERPDAAGVGDSMTGSEAPAILGVASRATNDIDIVIDLAPVACESRLRPAFEPALSNAVRTVAARAAHARSDPAAVETRGQATNPQRAKYPKRTISRTAPITTRPAASFRCGASQDAAIMKHGNSTRT